MSKYIKVKLSEARGFYENQEQIEERNKENKFKKDLYVVKKGKEEVGKGINFAHYQSGHLADKKGHDYGLSYGDYDDASEKHASRKTAIRTYKVAGRKAIANEEVEDLEERNKENKLKKDLYDIQRGSEKAKHMQGRPATLGAYKALGRSKVDATEETELQELSKKTLASYIKKSSHDVATKGALTRHYGEKSEREREDEKYSDARKSAEKADKIFNKSWKRREGIAKAADKLATEETEISEESLTKGMRLVSKHQGQDGHHAEVRHNADWGEYQVHHYHNGKHMGEGPVSYHDNKKDATDTANYEIKHYRPKDGKLHSVSEEVETLDELSRKTVASAGSKALRKALSGDEKHFKSANLASAKLYPDQYKNSPLKAKVAATNEEVETLDELSKKTLKSYIGKSTKQLASAYKDYNSDEDHVLISKRSKGTTTAMKNLAKESVDFDDADDMAEVQKTEVAASKTGEVLKTKLETSTGTSKPTGTKTGITSGKTGEAYNTTPLTKRIPALESAIMDVMKKNVDLRRIHLEASHITIISPEQRNDWMQVEQGKLPVLDYFNKYKV